MLSQYSDDAVAAVGLSNQIIAVGIMILGIVSLGSSIQLMQLIGSSKTTYIKIYYQKLGLFKCSGFDWFSTCFYY